MKKILTIIGARPQFIKAGIVSKAIKKCEGLSETLVHTGQHFDSNISDIFFNQLTTPKPDVELIDAGVNILASANMNKIIESTTDMLGKEINDPTSIRRRLYITKYY